MRKITSHLSWSGLAWHLLAFLVASLSVGFLTIATPAMLEILKHPATLGKPGLLPFVLTMGLFMGSFFTLFGGPFVLGGIVLGALTGLRQGWFCALWGSFSTVATAFFFHDPGQRLDLRFYLIVAGAGLIAGVIYWSIAVRGR